MRPVRQVYVGETRSAEHGAVAHRRAVVGVAGGVLWSVGFGLDDDAGGEPFGALVGEDAAEEIDRDLPGVPVIEISLQNILGDSGSPVRSDMRRESSSRSSPASERIEDLRRGRTEPISVPTMSRRIVLSVRPAVSGSGRPST